MNIKRTLLLIALSLSVVSLNSCKKNVSDDTKGIETEIDDNKAAPDGFDYSTTKPIDVTIRLLSPDDKPISGVMVSVYNPSNVRPGSELTKSITDKDGYVNTTIVLPTSIEQLVIDPAYIGLVRNAQFAISGKSLIATIGGKNGISANFVANTVSSTMGDNTFKLNSLSVIKPNSTSTVGSPVTPTVYVYDAINYDSYGRPLNLVAPEAPATLASLMGMLNASLPERKNGIELHPEYISTQAPSNLTVTTLSDVWITFVHEGADYMNSLAYYTYPTGHKPATAADIDSVKLIFPNASLLAGVGTGNMRLGDKIKIGRFRPGTSIGFVLLQKAYNYSTKIVNTTSATLKFYSDEAYNPESSLLKRHNVLLQTPGSTNKLFVVGFEDIKRDISSCDHDFNDLVFFAQTNAVNALDPTDIPYLEDRVEDTDHDGVPDVNDEYPTDPKRAYNRYYPSKDIWGTLAFEDNWPLEGDYDLNDLVLSYRYTFVMNSNNAVQDVINESKPLAAGAVFNNGFGIEFKDIAANKVLSTTGQQITGSYINLTSAGIENQQDFAVMIPFDDHKKLYHTAAAFINTKIGGTKLNADTVKVTMTLKTANHEQFLASVPFNPFLIANSVRGKEVHLVGQKPTKLANPSLLGTGSDRSNPLANKYYISTDNRPFAMNFVGSFEHPIELTNIKDAYLHFGAWAASSGVSFKDWYSNTAGGYRNTAKIYHR